MRHALQMLRLGLLFLSHVAVAFTIVEPMTVCHAVKVDGTYEFSFVSHDDRLSEKLHARPFGASVQPTRGMAAIRRRAWPRVEHRGGQRTGSSDG